MTTNTTPLQALCVEKGITMTTTKSAARGKAPSENMPNNWRVRLEFHGRVLYTDFFGGSAVTTVDVADVLSSLCSDARGGAMSFEDFCSEFDYDTDSRKAFATHQACCAMAKKLRKLLDTDFDVFCAAEH